MSRAAHPSPKVLVVDLSNNYGGSSSRVLSLMTRAKPGSISLAGLKSGAITGQAIKLGLPVHILGSHKADPRLLFHLINVIRQEDYNLLDSQNIQSKFWANLAALITGTTLVSTLNSWYANEHGKASAKGKFYTSLELLSNQSLGLYITVSEKDRQSLLKAGVPAESVELIYNAVDVNLSSVPGDSQWIRQKFELPPNSIICTAVGRLVRVKGYDVLIEAFQNMAAQVPNLFCLIVGEGECKEELSAQIRETGLENRVRLLGYYDRQKTMSILKSSDLFVMPSRYEGTPIALLEAAALARPILASATGGIPELVKHGEHAWLVPPGDSAALAEGLVKLSSDRDYAQRLGQNAQARIQENFDLDSQGNATWKAYEKALVRHKLRKK